MAGGVGTNASVSAIRADSVLCALDTGDRVDCVRDCFGVSGVGRWTADELWRQALQPLGVELLRKTLRDVAEGKLVCVPQDHRLATWEPALDPPALYRPDLPRLGRMPEGYRVVVESPDELPVLM